MKRRIIFGILAVLWLGFIFFNSLQDAETSGGISQGLLEMLGLPYAIENFVRKLAHFTFFMVLGILVSGALSAKKFPGVAILLCVLLCACADETLQLFSLGRSSELKDVWIDFAGGAMGVVVTALYGFWKKKQKITIEK